MRVAVTADLHLRSLSETPKRYGALEEILKTLHSNDIGLLIIAGDLFDADIRDFSDFEALLGKPQFKGTRILAMPGNHDPGLRQSHFALRNIRIIQSPTVIKLTDSDRAITMIPYGCASTFADAVGALSGQPISGSILIGHGDFLAGRALRSNPYEAGFYMPLTRRDLDTGHFPLAILGHIHSPVSFGDVHYAGSPCPVDRTETGRRSFLEIDLSNGTVRRIGLAPGLLYFRDCIAMVPGPGETRHVRSSIAAIAERWKLTDEEMDAAQISMDITGFADSREAVAETVSAALAETFGRREFTVDYSRLQVADDSSRAALATEAFSRLSEMSSAGDWPAGPDAPDVSLAAEKALQIIYGGR